MEIAWGFAFPPPKAGREKYYDRSKQTGRAPITEVQMVLFAAFCNWLSEQHGISESEWCFVPHATETYVVRILEDGTKIREPYLVIADDYHERHGFRFPTESEWGYACGTPDRDSFCCGFDELLIGQYSRFERNNNGYFLPTDVGAYKPNRFGLFDMQGNADEWRILDKPENETAMFGTKGGSLSSAPDSLIPYRQLPFDFRGSMSLSTGFRVVRKIR